MKAGLGKDGKVMRVKRISTESTLASVTESVDLFSSESPQKDGIVNRRRSSVEVAERRGSRTLQARTTIQNVNSGGRGSTVFEKTMDPRNLARIEFEEAKRLAQEFHMDFNEVKQVIDIFYCSDQDESGGLDKKELERAMARCLDVYVVPNPDVEKAWKFMIGKRPKTIERLLDEVTIEAFFHWYVENVGGGCLSRSVRRRPSLLTELTTSASETAVAVKSKLPPSVQRLLPGIKPEAVKAIPSPSTPSTRPPTSPSKSATTSPSDNSSPELGRPSPEGLPTISVQAAGPSPSGARVRAVSEDVLSPRSPGASSWASEPLSPLSPLSPPTPAGPTMSKEQVEALRKRFDRFAEGSGVCGVLFYPQFILMFCELFHIPTPQGSNQKWINLLWKEIDSEKCGRVNFEHFCDWYSKHFDVKTGGFAQSLPGMI
jgi:Ca2+-binding EF-hand superfamily protein